MALPARLTPILRPIGKVAKVITPTGVGVLLSVGAHAALLLFGPRTDLSFAALSQAAQQAESEETIVPLVQLTPAERNRLPSFAQPRKPPLPSTGLGNLALPSGLPSVPNTSIPRRQQVAAKPFPAAVTPRTQPRRTPVRRTPAPALSRTLPNSIPIRQLPTLPSLGLGRRSSGVPVVPSTPSPAPAAPSSSPAETNPNSSPGTAADVLPRLEPATPDGGGFSVADALAQAEANARQNAPDIARSAGPDEPAPEALPLPEEGGEDTTTIPVEPPAIATVPAQGDSTLLLEGNNDYDDTAVSDEESQGRERDWLIATAEGKTEVATDSAEISIDSGFKACREVPPVDGRIGVVVNPDGSQSDATVLKSIGYDVLNRLALRTLEYEEFEPVDIPKQYTVDVKVKYAPEDCEEGLTEAEIADDVAE